MQTATRTKLEGGLALLAVMCALAAPAAAADTPPHVTFRFKVPVKVARAFSASAHRQASAYGYPVHGCAFTHAQRIYGCAVSAPGDWQILTRPKVHLYYEDIVQNDHITQRLQLRHVMKSLRGS